MEVGYCGKGHAENAKQGETMEDRDDMESLTRQLV